ncbi:hypothetical protein MCBG_02275 [Micromonospora sp. M42]|nr:hypothetical protein MCBG_02275 [Micromonospora sp. M42]
MCPTRRPGPIPGVSRRGRDRFTTLGEMAPVLWRWMRTRPSTGVPGALLALPVDTTEGEEAW